MPDPVDVEILVGDCLDVLASLPAGSVDAVVTDPPYGDARQPRAAWKQASGRTYDGPPPAEWLVWLRERLEAIRRVMKPAAPVALAIGPARVHELAMLLREVWPAREVVTIAVDTGHSAARRGVIHRVEYVLIATEPGTILGAPGLFSGGETRSGWAALTLSTLDAGAHPRQVYPVWTEPDSGRIVGIGRSVGQLLADGALGTLDEFDYADVEPAPAGCVSIWPMTRTGRRGIWRMSRAAAVRAHAEGWIRADRPHMPGNVQPFVVKYLPAGVRRRIATGEVPTHGLDERGALVVGRVPPAGSGVPTLWSGARYETATGSDRLRELLGDDVGFAYPQAVGLVEDLVQVVTGGRRDVVVLDPFAGSGTTGDAVLQLNAADRGARRAVLIERDAATAELARRRVEAAREATRA